MKKTIIAVFAVLVLGAGGYGVYQAVNSQPADTTTSSTTTEPTKKVTLVFSEEGKKVTYDGLEGQTALVALQLATKVVTKSSDFGQFVTGINGVVAEESSEYWSFYVNGAYASEGAGTYVMKAADKIEWRLEKL